MSKTAVSNPLAWVEDDSSSSETGSSDETDGDVELVNVVRAPSPESSRTGNKRPSPLDLDGQRSQKRVTFEDTYGTPNSASNGSLFTGRAIPPAVRTPRSANRRRAREEAGWLGGLLGS